MALAIINQRRKQLRAIFFCPSFILLAFFLTRCAGYKVEPVELQDHKELYIAAKIGEGAQKPVSIVKKAPAKAQILPKCAAHSLADKGRSYRVKGSHAYNNVPKHYKEKGYASWYGSAFHGRKTANGEIYDMYALTAAHKYMPLPSYAKVTNLATGASLIVRVNDRGPYIKGRIIDLSKRAAELLKYQRSGLTKVEIEYLGPAPLCKRAGPIRKIANRTLK